MSRRPVGTELGGQDPYTLLGVPRDASAADIAAARRRALLREHPDRGGDPHRAAHINAAAALLGDPNRRRDYDEQTLTSATPGEPHEPAGRPAPGPPPDSRPGTGPPPDSRPGTGPPPDSRPGTGPPGAGWVPPAWKPPRPPAGANDFVHPGIGDIPPAGPFPYPTYRPPYGADNPYAGSYTGSPPPRRVVQAPRRKRRLRHLVLAVAVMIVAIAALGQVDLNHTPAVHHPATPKTAFWTAVVDSERESSAGHPHANASVAVLKRQGYIALPVFRSRQYPSLKPGYWLVAVGRFPTSRQAAATATRLQARGFTWAYPCCLGTAAGCSGHALAQ